MGGPSAGEDAATELEPSWLRYPAALLGEDGESKPLFGAVKAPSGCFCHICYSTYVAGGRQLDEIQTG